MYMWRERSKEEKHEDVVNTGLLPLDVVEGFKIRPGFFRMYGACVAPSINAPSSKRKVMAF